MEKPEKLSAEYLSKHGIAVTESHRAVCRKAFDIHDYLVCINCGKIVEFNRPDIKAAQKEVAEEHGFRMVPHALRIEGLCAECREKNGTAQFEQPHQASRPVELPLSMVGGGERVRICMIRGGRNIKQRLASMGVTPGDEIEVLQNLFSGPITIRVKDTRIAIGHGISHKVMVKPISRL
jgi:Fur family ferric uptake transcriptional regulator